MTKKSPICKHIDFTPLLPDEIHLPLCKFGHEWSQNCMSGNLCPDYHEQKVYRWNHVKKELGL